MRGPLNVFWFMARLCLFARPETDDPVRLTAGFRIKLLTSRKAELRGVAYQDDST